MRGALSFAVRDSGALVKGGTSVGRPIRDRLTIRGYYLHISQGSAEELIVLSHALFATLYNDHKYH